jgi:hypothetical protein
MYQTHDGRGAPPHYGEEHGPKEPGALFYWLALAIVIVTDTLEAFQEARRARAERKRNKALGIMMGDEVGPH